MFHLNENEAMWNFLPIDKFERYALKFRYTYYKLRLTLCFSKKASVWLGQQLHNNHMKDQFPRV